MDFQAIVVWIKGLLTPEQWVQLTSFAGDVAFVALLIFCTTQIVKVTIRNLHGNPRNIWVHLLSVTAAMVWGFFVLSGDLDMRIAIGVIAWVVAFLGATYGLGFLKEFAPRVYLVFNGDRRRAQKFPPTDYDKRNPQ